MNRYTFVQAILVYRTTERGYEGYGEHSRSLNHFSRIRFCENYKTKGGEDTLKEVHYGLARNAWNTVYHRCRYICDSWIYRQGSLDNCEVDYYRLDYPCVNFPNHRTTPLLTFYTYKKNSLINR